jgi:hypothetical protein
MSEKKIEAGFAAQRHYKVAPMETRRLGFMAMMLSIVGSLGALIIGSMEGDGWRHFSHAYLFAVFYFLTIGLGALFFVLIQHLTRAGWSVLVRRCAEMIANTLPFIALLFIPILWAMWAGFDGLYSWVSLEHVQSDHLLKAKSPYLNMSFFAARYVFYLIVWRSLSRFFLTESARQDETGSLVHSARMQYYSAPGLALMALSITFVSIDWVMSITPHWYSTMFGVYAFAGSMVSFLSSLIIVVRLLQWRGYLKEVTIEHYHDLGKLLFGFVFFWGYIAFSQFMLMWYGNMPEETIWYWVKQQHGWEYVGMLLIAVHFALPFPGLLSRHVKRHPNALMFWASWLLLAHAVDLYWLILPNCRISPDFGLMEIFCFLFVAGVFRGILAYAAEQQNIYPIRDPRLDESIHLENI